MTSESEMQRQLAEQVQRLNSEMSGVPSLVPAVGEIRRNVAKLDGIARDTSRLEGIAKEIAEVRRQLGRVEGAVTRIHEQQIRNETIAQARDERMHLENRLRTEFAGRNEIRRLARSLISAPGSAAIRDRMVEASTMIDAAGKHMFKEAEHWLGAVVVALVAEHLDHGGTVSAAWSSAETSDAARTGLFLSLFYSLQGRHEAAAVSMSDYLEHLDPRALGHEFSHVINAIAEGEMGPDADSYARKALDRWGLALSAPQSAADTTFSRQFLLCRNHLLANEAELPSRFPLLRHHIDEEQWQGYADGWKYVAACGAAAHGFTLRFQRPEGAPDPSARREHSRRALRLLIDQPGPDEIELLRRKRVQQSIIDCGGDREEAAKREQSLGDPYAPTHDLATFLTQAAFETEVYHLTPRAQRLTLACAQNWIMAAARSVKAQAEQLRPSRVPVQWDGWEGVIDTEQPVQAETDRLKADLCGYIAHTNRLRKPGALSVLYFLVGLALPICGVIWGRGLVLGGFVAAGVLIVLGVGVEIVTYPSRLTRRAQEIAEMQRTAVRTLPGLIEEARSLAALWDSTAQQGLAELGRTLQLVSTVDGARTDRA